MTPIRLDENWLTQNPQVAERIRQAEAAQSPPPPSKMDVPGRPRSDEKGQAGMIYPTRPVTSRKMSYSWLIPAGAVLLLLMGGVSYGMGGQGTTSRYLQSMQQHIAQVTVPQPVQPTPAQTAPQTTQQPAVNQPMQTTQQPAAPAVTITPVQQPAQSAAGMTVQQYYDQTKRAPGGIPLDAGQSPHVYTEESIYIPGGMYTFKGPFDQVTSEWNAAFNLPVSAFENQSRPPITGQMVGNDLQVVLEVSGPNGVKTIQGKIDSGTVTTAFPDSFLRSLGYTPVNTENVLGVTGQQTEGVYDIPFIQIRGNGGQWETLYAGTLPVWGDQFNEALVGADVLKQASLSVNGNTFILGFPN